jgi:hypothetical protein
MMLQQVRSHPGSLHVLYFSSHYRTGVARPVASWKPLSVAIRTAVVSESSWNCPQSMPRCSKSLVTGRAGRATPR